MQNGVIINVVAVRTIREQLYAECVDEIPIPDTDSWGMACFHWTADDLNLRRVAWPCGLQTVCASHCVLPLQSGLCTRFHPWLTEPLKLFHVQWLSGGKSESDRR